MVIVKCQNRNKKEFGKFIEEYLFTRENILKIVLLLDIRHTPTQNDKMMYDYIKSTNKPYVIIANKADKIAVTKVDAAVSEIRNSLNLTTDEIILPFSSERKIYSDMVWKNILIGVEM